LATEELEQRLEDIERIATAVNMFDSFELQLAAFSYLTKGQIILPSSAVVIEGPSEPEAIEAEVLEEAATPSSEAEKPRTPRKRNTKKPVFTQDKNLQLHPKDAPSFGDTAALKAPANVVQKCVVAVYWLREHGNVDTISATHVYTCFKAAGWQVPNDLVNTLSQAGTRGYLQVNSRDDVALTTIGENFVEHKLPAPVKA
jgi:hypothetical protein